ncbi:hypothetical protein F-liban_337 [Faustovirus]|nr:hypothetical protein F-liban_337 [Faustovirus]
MEGDAGLAVRRKAVGHAEQSKHVEPDNHEVIKKMNFRAL